MENRIKDLRNSRRITQEKLAELLSTSKGMISMLESGERRLNTDWIKKLCEVFSVRPSEIFQSDLDYRETIISEKIAKLRPETLQKVDEYIDLLLLKHNGSNGEQ